MVKHRRRFKKTQSVYARVCLGVAIVGFVIFVAGVLVSVYP